MTTATIREHLRGTRFCQGLTDTAIHQLARLVTHATFESDRLLFEEGGPREFAAILRSGSVAVEKQVNGRPVRLITLGEGEAAGEEKVASPAGFEPASPA